MYYTLCSQFINSQDYTNCIRTEDGFCGIEWKEKSGTSNGEPKMKDHNSAFFLISSLKGSQFLVLKSLSPRCFLPLRLSLNDRSGCLSNHERLHSQPQVRGFHSRSRTISSKVTTSGKIWNAVQVPRTLTLTRQHNDFLFQLRRNQNSRCHRPHCFHCCHLPIPE